ncbi:MAG: long-chain fatty acid--CoA ligase [Proteobacteria bacterium]|nr:long-chain fatty acid--CoA ligase [Pseudomonadota bacterium]
MTPEKHGTAIGAFLERARAAGDRPFALFKAGGRYREISCARMRERVLRCAAGLSSRGVGRADRVAIMLTTRLEWTVADLAVMAAGAISVPVYCALTPERIAHILRDSAPKAAFVEDARVARLFEEARKIGGIGEGMQIFGLERGAGSASLDELESMQDSAACECIEALVEGLSGGDPATYVYTSGTTGALKGVVVTHGMIMSEVLAAGLAFRFTHRHVGLIALPLAHVLGRMIQFYHAVHGPVLAYAESLERLAENYLEVRPHFVCGVPRMLEKIHERVWEHLRRAGPRSRRMAQWALAVGRERSQAAMRFREIPLALRLRHAIADLVVFRRLRSRLGGRLSDFVCGGARLSEEVSRFFHAAGIRVLEGYGLTETFAAVTANTPGDFRLGTVGKPLSGVAIKLAPDGEILLKGPMVFREYLNMPRETAEAFDAEGWFRTGDLGEYSRDGFLRITGRKKEMIVTAGGKNISPQLIESELEGSPLVHNAMAYGDGRRYVTALVAVNLEEAAKAAGIEGRDAGMLKDPRVIGLIEGHVRRCNERLAKYETVKRFALVEGPFTVAGGELTPTFKIRREFVAEKYHDLLNSLY